jgi:hypothetical protein
MDDAKGIAALTRQALSHAAYFHEQYIDDQLRRNDPIVGPPREKSGSQGPRGFRRFLLAFALVLGIGFGIFDSRKIRVDQVEAPCHALPPGLDGFRIIQLSDLHSTPDFRRNLELADILEEMKADAMVITGDFRMGGGSPRTAADGARIAIGTVGARMPVFAVQGNNDTAETMRLLEGEGIKVLDNRAVRIADRLWIAGWNPYLKGHPPLERVLGAIPSDAAVVLASHSPDVILEEGFSRAQLILAGHTHGLQIRIPGLPPPITLTRVGWRYTRGLYRLRDTLLYINRGIGTSMLPLRMYSPPEVTLLRLRAFP